MSQPMYRLSADERLRLGLRAAGDHMHRQDKLWSRYSNDKVDIAAGLARVIRTLNKALPLDAPMRALSIGSSNEPQFRILESAFREGFYLLDIETAALTVVEERIRRQSIRHVRAVHGDYNATLMDEQSLLRFRKDHLDDQRMTLITLHHSLYYSPTIFWDDLLARLYEHLLASEPGSGPSGAIHAVLMASRSDDPTSTTWVYNYFADRFFGHRNDQDLQACALRLRADARFADAQVLSKSTRVHFFVDDFEIFMAVLWMILLHPHVHQFNEEQQREVIEWAYEYMWSRAIPLVQMQDHLVIYRGKGIAGLI
jgi:hypothetical protein